MSLIHQVILYLFVRTTLCQNYTVTVSFNKTKHITKMYGECFKIPYEYTPPWKNVTFLYTEVWFYGNTELRNGPLTFPRHNGLTLQSLPPGEYVFGLRLEWGHNKTYTYPKTVQVSVSASTKSPEVTMHNLIKGQPTILRCTAPMLCNRESPEISWTGPKMTPIPRRHNIMRYSPKTSTVQITPRAEDHNTNVTCRLHYRYNVLTEKTVILKVQYPPKILSSSKCVHKENTIVCKCISQGNPLPSIHWFSPNEFSVTKYNDSQTAEGIMHIQESYNFTIRCVSSNYLGSETKNFTAQRSISNPTCETKNAVSVPWSITGVSLCLCLVMLIIVIFQYKQ
ncbi:hypothetical protein NL108_003208 [Boleophthalmus pectinirostris]|nr:hypothetical protein NL108_003208 [Boleophthalmus pectinirostris]